MNMCQYWAAVFVAVSAGAACFAQPQNPARFGWMTDYNQAKAAARKSGKPLMVVFRCEP